MEFTTADLCDGYPELVQVAQPEFREYGGLAKFSGPIETLSVFEDNALVRQILETDGGGRVLVIDGGGSRRCALVGGRLGTRGLREWLGGTGHQWQRAGHRGAQSDSHRHPGPQQRTAPQRQRGSRRSEAARSALPAWHLSRAHFFMPIATASWWPSETCLPEALAEVQEMQTARHLTGRLRK